jgi:hypothetical protein
MNASKKLAAAFVAGAVAFSFVGFAAAEEQAADHAAVEMEKCVGTDKADPSKVVEMKKGECASHGGTVVEGEKDAHSH